MSVQSVYKWVEAEEIVSEISTQDSNGYELKEIIESGGNYGLLFVKGSSKSSPSTVGSGYSTFRNTSVSNSAVDVKGSEGNVYGWNIINDNSSPTYLRLYNDEASNVTVGTTTPIETLKIPANGTAFLEVRGIEQVHFNTALSIVAVTESGDSGSTAPSNGLIVHLKYQ